MPAHFVQFCLLAVIVVDIKMIVGSCDHESLLQNTAVEYDACVFLPFHKLPEYTHMLQSLICSQVDGRGRLS